MNNRYRCDICGCYLDPGEGLLCDECRQNFRNRQRMAKKIMEAVRESDSGQVEMRLEEIG